MSNSKYAGSDSSVQRRAEGEMLGIFSRDRGFKLSKDPQEIGNAKVNFDGIDLERKVLVEAYAHVGKLKSAQNKKIQSDFLKLLLFERVKGTQWDKFYLMSCKDAASTLTSGKSWMREAAEYFGIIVLVIDIGPDLTRELLSAQVRQDLTR
jgi:hypothetical protein